MSSFVAILTRKETMWNSTNFVWKEPETDFESNLAMFYQANPYRVANLSSFVAVSPKNEDTYVKLNMVRIPIHTQYLFIREVHES